VCVASLINKKFKNLKIDKLKHKRAKHNINYRSTIPSLKDIEEKIVL